MADPAPIEPAPIDPTPQPVVRSAAVLALILFVLSKFALLSRHFDWWDPTPDDLEVIAEFAADLFAAAVVVQAWIVHKRVMPMVKVAKVVEAAKAEGYSQAVAEVHELAAVQPAKMLAPVEAGTVRSVTEVDAGYLTAVRWDDGTIGEYLFPEAHPEGARVSR